MKSVISLWDTPEDQRDLAWLRAALEVAVALEFATIPPYLTAAWTIAQRNAMTGRWERTDNPDNPARESIVEVALEEMIHMGIACNLLVAVGGTVDLTSADRLPTYPGGLPGGLMPDLEVGLERFTPELVTRVFLRIEYPQKGPIPLSLVPPPPTIGDFYDAILCTFERLNPPLDAAWQIDVGSFFSDSGLIPDGLVTIVTSLDEVRTAICQIKEQGEGNETSPAAPEDLPQDASPDFAHYYRFREMEVDRKIAQVDGHWRLTDEPFGNPDDRTGVIPMAPLPRGGYPGVASVEAFNRVYTAMLKAMEEAWRTGGAEGEAQLDAAISKMRRLGSLALDVLNEPLPDNAAQHYGPDFRLAADV